MPVNFKKKFLAFSKLGFSVVEGDSVVLAVVVLKLVVSDAGGDSVVLAVVVLKVVAFDSGGNSVLLVVVVLKVVVFDAGGDSVVLGVVVLKIVVDVDAVDDSLVFVSSVDSSPPVVSPIFSVVVAGASSYSL